MKPSAGSLELRVSILKPQRFPTPILLQTFWELWLIIKSVIITLKQVRTFRKFFIQYDNINEQSVLRRFPVKVEETT